MVNVQYRILTLAYAQVWRGLHRQILQINTRWKTRRDLNNALLCTVLVEARLGEEYTNMKKIIEKNTVL